MTRLRNGSLAVVLWGVFVSACVDGAAEVDAGFPSEPDARVVEIDAGHVDVVEDGGEPLDAGWIGVPSCTNERHDATETGVDCGGDCPPCASDEHCEVGADCESGRCVDGRCASASCSDGLMNGQETDVDCGGPECTGCVAGGGCARGSDCVSEICDLPSSTCLAAGCDDGMHNGDETDVDCGGSCPGCSDGARCDRAGDCVDGYCTETGLCATPTCTDGARNGDEIGIDCGGGDCPGCRDGEPCLAGSDCTSEVCADGACAVATCTDGVMNADETDVDCGGRACPACPTGGGCGSAIDCLGGVCDAVARTCQAPSCTDGLRNGDETAVDCGGGACRACEAGDGCTLDGDCASRICIRATATCADASCTDGVRNGDESGVDCGGSVCAPCVDGRRCERDLDCMSGVCDATARVCLGPSCSDGVRNGTEVDVDCGGSCPGCGAGTPCDRPSDCASGVCDSTTFTCATPSCTDGIMNGDETDVDCGGGSCPACDVGEGCTVGGDCATHVCGAVTSTCSAPSCMDGIRNGDESDVDCGGSCPACATGGRCFSHGDCGGYGYCVANRCAFFQSCREILAAGASVGSGPYTIVPSGAGPIRVYCDMTTEGGGWTRVAQLAAGTHPLGSIYRGQPFFTRAWIQGDTGFTTTTNDRVDLSRSFGMLDARRLFAISREVRFSCQDATRGHTADALWVPEADDLAALLASRLGGEGYATASASMWVSRDHSAFSRVDAYPTSAPTAFWGNAHICGSGAGGGAPTAGASDGFQLGVCHNGPSSSDIGIANANQVAIGYQSGYEGLRLECTADTPTDTPSIDGTWMAWVR